MFTGIIRHHGTIKKITPSEGLTRLTIEAHEDFLNGKKVGDSIAVDGACLTVVELSDGSFSAEAIPETLSRTIIQNYREGRIVNLENPLRIGDTLDGHFVQGHIDFAGTVKDVRSEGGSKIIAVELPPEYKKFFAQKGSVTLNGVSLTVSAMTDKTFEIALIPESLKKTNLSNVRSGDTINVEIDMVSRYVHSQQ
ncbi:MAG TPA: riboflavin synthase [Candidatus Gracilibacteria bacterium]|nr:riboflavin synthase [Candidatus Gracilibacteria bacterium]